MTTLADWIDYGRSDQHNRNKRLVRRWVREHRGRFPVRDWVSFPDCGYERRQFPRGE